jgi:hypothetical protein
MGRIGKIWSFVTKGYKSVFNSKTIAKQEKWLGLSSLKKMYNQVLAKLGLQKGMPFSTVLGKFVSGTRWSAWASSVGSKLFMKYPKIFHYMTNAVIKSKQVTNVFAKTLVKGKSGKIFGRKFPQFGLSAFKDKTTTIMGGKFINPIIKLRSKSSAGAPSRLKRSLTFVGSLVSWELGSMVLENLFEDEGIDGGTNFTVNELESFISETSNAKYDNSNSLGTSDKDISLRDVNEMSLDMQSLISKANLDMLSAPNPGQVLALIDSLLSVISTCDRADVMRSHTINALLDPNYTGASDALKDLVYVTDEETAEKASAIYLESLRLAKDTFQKELAEELIDDDDSIHPILMLPSFTNLGEVGIWNFDGDFDEDDIKLLSDFDDSGSDLFERSMKAGFFANDKNWADYKSRHNILAVAGSNG